MGDYLRTAFEIGAVIVVCAVVALEEREWRWRRAVDGVLWLTALVVTFRALMVGWNSATTPRPWDSPAFYTVARAAVVENSFYDPETLRSVFDRSDGYFPNDWLSEIGYWYPPPSILTIYPAGFFDAENGLVAHHIFHGAFLAASIMLLGRWFPVVEGARAFAAAAVLVLSLQPTIDAIHLGQIVFGSMVGIIVAVRFTPSRSLLAGAALGLGTLFKPLAIIVAVLWTLAGRVRPLIGALASLAVSAVLTALLFGIGVYSDFIEFGPSDRSSELSLNPVIQSLNGVLRRLTNDPPGEAGAIAAVLHPATLVASSGVLLVTLAVLRHARPWASERETIGLVVSASLLLYPNTLVSTLSLLAIPIAVGLHVARQGRIELSLASVIAVGTVALTAGVVEPFFGLAFLWCGSVLSILWTRPHDRLAVPDDALRRATALRSSGTS